MMLFVFLVMFRRRGSVHSVLVSALVAVFVIGAGFCRRRGVAAAAPGAQIVGAVI